MQHLTWQVLQLRWDQDHTATVQAFVEENLLVDTARARCSCRHDEERLVKEIKSHGGFAQIDNAVFQKRKQLTQV